jgi:predicted phosphodiesterase
MNKTEIVREYRNKYGMEMPNLKLARIIYNENPLVFPTIDAVRTALRNIQKGYNHPQGQRKVTHPHADRPLNPYKLPESYKKEPQVLKLPTGCDNILVISDLHIPYHDIESISIAIEYGINADVNTVFINGDLIDFHGISRFEKDPRKRSVKQEFEATKSFLIALRDAFPTQEIYWLLGNHDMRYEKWLMTKVYEVFDDEYYHMEQRLQLNEQRVRLINDNVLVKAGKLAITHGHHVMKGFFAPVNSARGAWMKAKQSLLISHVHKVSNHVEVNLDGDSFGTWSTGCLSELKPDYNPLVSNYQHGFAHVLIDKAGDFQVKNYQIINGKIH